MIIFENLTSSEYNIHKSPYPNLPPRVPLGIPYLPIEGTGVNYPGYLEASLRFESFEKSTKNSNSQNVHQTYQKNSKTTTQNIKNKSSETPKPLSVPQSMGNRDSCIQ